MTLRTYIEISPNRESLNSDLRDLEVHPTEDDVAEEGFTGQECQNLIENIQQDACEEKDQHLWMYINTKQAQEPLKKLNEISTDLALARCPLRNFIVTKFITCAFGRWV